MNCQVCHAAFADENVRTVIPGPYGFVTGHEECVLPLVGNPEWTASDEEASERYEIDRG